MDCAPFQHRENTHSQNICLLRASQLDGLTAAEAKNPHNRNGPPMRLYKRAEVSCQVDIELQFPWYPRPVHAAGCALENEQTNTTK